MHIEEHVKKNSPDAAYFLVFFVSRPERDRDIEPLSRSLWEIRKSERDSSISSFSVAPTGKIVVREKADCFSLTPYGIDTRELRILHADYPGRAYKVFEYAEDGVLLVRSW